MVITYDGSKTVQQILHDSLVGVDDVLAKKIVREKKWRENYIEHFLDLHRVMIDHGKTIAQNGMKSVYGNISWNGVPLEQVEIDKANHHGFETITIQGGGEFRMLDKDSLLQKTEEWTREGLCVANVLTSMKRLLIENPEWLDLRGQTFVILGANSQMGPTKLLLQLGATVIAIDLPSNKDTYSSLVENTCGKLILPQNKEGLVGTDIVQDLPRLAAWIIQEIQHEQRVVVGSYLYMDGMKFVKIAAAADCLTKLVQENVSSNTKIIRAFLCSPSETYLWPQRERDMAQKRYEQRYQTHPGDLLLRLITFGKTLVENKPVHQQLVNCYTPEQGPNYAFAKLIQKWTAILHNENTIATIAPASMTKSVMSFQMVKWGILGCQRFGIVPFQPNDANTIMTALLIHDINHQQPQQQNVLHMFTNNAVHGGTMTAPYKPASTTKISVLVYLLSKL